MADLTTVQDIRDAVETDLPDSVLQRLIDTAETDVRGYMSADQLMTLPTVLLDGALVITPGDTLTLATPSGSLGNYSILRFEGTAAGESWTLDTRAFVASGAAVTSTITPASSTGPIVGAEFELTGNDYRTEFMFDGTATTVEVTVARVIGFQTVEPPIEVVSVIIDLVKLAVDYDLVSTERVGQYSETKKDYSNERYKVLKRVLFASGESLVA